MRVRRKVFLNIVLGFPVAISLRTLVSAPTCSTSAGEPEKDIMVGVLEDVPGYYAGQSDFRAVRAVFKKAGNDWQAFPTDCRNVACLNTVAEADPVEVTWTITFDGRSLGQVTGRTSKQFKF
jgi:hypothetical protein